MKIEVKFNWHEKWFGVRDEIKTKTTIPKYDFLPMIETFHHVWICTIPCFPIHIWWEVKDEWMGIR